MSLRNDASGIAQVIRSSNMRQITRIYRQCSQQCSFPIKCLFGRSEVMYKIIGNYTLSKNSEFNTVFRFTEDVTFILYVPVRTITKVALQSDPNNIIFTIDVVNVPGSYTIPAGYQGLIINVYVNFPSC
jgi:hypothetical protein